MLSIVTSVYNCLSRKHAPVVISLCGIIVFYSAWKRGKRRDKYILPPSPPPELLFGHLRKLPAEFQWKTFSEWGKLFGDLIYISLLGKPVIILNSAEAANDLLNKKASLYSDRPRFVLHAEMFNLTRFMPFMRYGQDFRDQRRLIQQQFNSRAVSVFRSIQTKQINIFLKNLLTSPKKVLIMYTSHGFSSFRLSTSTLFLATYGHEMDSEEDKFYKLACEVATKTEIGVPGATPVDFFPILQYFPSWLPGTGFQKVALEVRRLTSELLNQPFFEVQRQRNSGIYTPSLVNRMLENYESRNTSDLNHEGNMRNAAGVIIAAGVESSEDVIMSFLLMMTRHPEVLEEAQKEIDTIIGNDRLPNLDDRTSIPFVECILKELYRFNPPLPLAIPHQNLEEDTYRNYNIPVDSMVIPNIWEMMRDERFFPDPEVFRPGRFKDKVYHSASRETKESFIGISKVAPDNPSSLVFGFGRRICPGRYFADSNTWLIIANLIAVFHIRPISPEKVPELKFSCGITSKPKPFECEITPRSKKCISLISNSASSDR